MPQQSITQLPQAGALTGLEPVPIVQNGVTVQTTTGAVAGAASLNYPFVTFGSTAGLTQARQITAGSGISLADGGVGSTLAVNLTGAALSLNSSGNGIQVKTASNTVTARSLAVGTGLTIANSDGVSGDPTIGLGALLLQMVSLTGTGMLALQSGSPAKVTLQGTASQTSITNGDGSANPVISLATDPVIPGTGGVVVPAGTTAQRGSSTVGNIRYNSSTGLFEGYNGTWTAFAAGSGVTSIATGTGLTGGPITSTGTISIANTTVVAGTYGSSSAVPVFVVNAQGQITSVTNTTIAAGTVTSVAQSFTGGIISVSGSPITTSGTLALTVAGTSGGVPYFTSTSTWATSALLAANGLMVGGGAGAAPSTVTTGTGVVTALGVNTGTAGAFVVNGGALGTPSSGTVTNLTGTASININGTVGATTATTGAFTTISASGVITSTVTTGTAPFTVASTTAVANLTATNAVNTDITAASTGATNYLTFVTTTSGNLPQLVNSSITANAVNGTITGGISGGAF